MWCLSQCLATGSDDLVRWLKHPGNPILPDPPGKEYARICLHFCGADDARRDLLEERVVRADRDEA